MISKGRFQSEFTIFSVFCGFQLGLALASLSTGSLVLCIPLIFGSLIGCWSVLTPSKTILKISLAVHAISTILLIGTAFYGYYANDLPTKALTYPNFWLYVLGVIVTASLTFASKAALDAMRRDEEASWRTPCAREPARSRSPARGEDDTICNFECVLQIPDSLFASEQISDVDRTIGIPVNIPLPESRSPTPGTPARSAVIKTSMTSPGPAASDYQSCKSNNLNQQRRYSHGENPITPNRCSHRTIEPYFTQHLSPRPAWVQMPSKFRADDTRSERGPTPLALP